MPAQMTPTGVPQRHHREGRAQYQPDHVRGRDMAPLVALGGFIAWVASWEMDQPCPANSL
jgi:hypothetical protein